MSDELLAKLKKLQYERSEDSPFASHVEFQRWSDSALPLLSFNEKLYAEFKRCVHNANSSHIIGSPLDSIGSINRAIGIVNQAITSLEIVPVPHIGNLTPSSANAKEDWYKKPIGQIGIGVFVVVIGAIAIYIIKTQLGVPL